MATCAAGTSRREFFCRHPWFTVSGPVRVATLGLLAVVETEPVLPTVSTLDTSEAGAASWRLEVDVMRCVRVAR